MPKITASASANAFFLINPVKTDCLLRRRYKNVTVATIIKTTKIDDDVPVNMMIQRNAQTTVAGKRSWPAVANNQPKAKSAGN